MKEYTFFTLLLSPSLEAAHVTSFLCIPPYILCPSLYLLLLFYPNSSIHTMVIYFYFQWKLDLKRDPSVPVKSVNSMDMFPNDKHFSYFPFIIMNNVATSNFTTCFQVAV